jgi:hypothetical protein
LVSVDGLALGQSHRLAGDPSLNRKGEATLSIARCSAGKLVNPILADLARIACGDFGIH